MCDAHYEVANELSFFIRRTGPPKSDTVASCNSMFEKKLVKIKDFEESHELSEENTYQDIAAKRHACFKSIRVRLQAYIFVIRSSKITVTNYHLVALVHSVAASDPTTSICARVQQYLKSRPHPRLQGAAK